eukprot:2787140-Alexandrium_andersonii.AAC.1
MAVWEGHQVKKRGRHRWQPGAAMCQITKRPTATLGGDPLRSAWATIGRTCPGHLSGLLWAGWGKVHWLDLA